VVAWLSSASGKVETMTLIQKRRVISLLVPAVLGFSAAALVGWKHAETKQPTTFAQWHDNFKTPKDMIKKVDVVAVVQTIGTKPGRVVRSTDGHHMLPFEVVSFRVLDALKGAKPGSTLEVERVGNADPDLGVVYLDADGGGFHEGHTYLLFLRKQRSGKYYIQVNDQGRYHVIGDSLEAVSPNDKVARLFHRRRLAESKALVKNSLE